MTMINNPTIDGVSRELLEESWAALMQKGKVLKALQIRDLLDAPVVERQPVEFPAGAIHNGRAFIDQLESIYAFKEQQGHPLSLCSEWQELTRCFEWLAAHATEAQSTIAQLQGRIAELEKDAARYQWLRDKSESCNQFYLSTPLYFTGVRFSKDNVDSTIDSCLDATAALNGVKS